MIRTAARWIVPSLMIVATALPALDSQVQYTIRELPALTGLSVTDDYFGMVKLSPNGAWGLVRYGNNGSYTYLRWSRNPSTLTLLPTSYTPASGTPRALTEYNDVANDGLIVGQAYNKPSNDRTDWLPIYITASGTSIAQLSNTYGGEAMNIGTDGSIVGDLLISSYNWATQTDYGPVRAVRWASVGAAPTILDNTAIGYASANTDGTYTLGARFPTGVANGATYWLKSAGPEKTWTKSTVESALGLSSAYGAIDDSEDVGLMADGRVLMSFGSWSDVTYPERLVLVNPTGASLTASWVPLPSGCTQSDGSNGPVARVTTTQGSNLHFVVGNGNAGNGGSTYVPFIWQAGDAQSYSLNNLVISGAGSNLYSNAPAINAQGEILACGNRFGGTGQGNDQRWYLLTPLSTVSVAWGVSSLTESVSSNPSATITASRAGLIGCTTEALSVQFTIGGTAANSRYSVSGGTVSGSALWITIPAGQTSAQASLTLLNDSLYQPSETVTLTPVAGSGSATGTAYAVSGGLKSLILNNDDVQTNPQPVISRSGSGVTKDPLTITVAFSEAVNGFIQSDLTASTGAWSGFSGSGASFTATWTPPASSEGTAIIGIAAAAATAQDDGANSLAATNLNIDYDTLAPAAPTVSIPASAATVGGSFIVSGPVPTGATSVTVNGQAATITDSSWSRTLSGQSSGNLSLSVIATDAAGNASAATNRSVTVDNSPPSLAVSTPTSPTNDATPTLSGTTDDAAATITVSKGGTVLGTGSGLNWSVTTSALADGAHTLVVTAVDGLGNTTTSAGIPIFVDTVAPAIVLGAPSATVIRTGSTPTITVTYADAATSVAAISLVDANVTVSQVTGTASATATVSGTGVATRTITLGAITGNGTITVSLAAHTATDAAGNQAASAGPSAIITVDNTAPAVSTVTTTTPALTALPAIPVTITFDGPVAAAPTITAGNAAVGTPTSTDNIVWLVTLTATAPGAVTVTGISAADAVGNVLTDATVRSIATYEAGVAVTVEQAATQADPTSSTTVNFTVTFASAIAPASFVNADLTIGGTATGTLVPTITPVGSANTTFTVGISGMTGNGTVMLSLAADKVQTAGGSNNSLSTSADNSVTWTAPSGGSSGSSGNGGGGCGVGGGLTGLLMAMMAMIGLRRRR